MMPRTIAIYSACARSTITSSGSTTRPISQLQLQSHLRLHLQAAGAGAGVGAAPVSPIPFARRAKFITISSNSNTIANYQHRGYHHQSLSLGITTHKARLKRLNLPWLQSYPPAPINSFIPIQTRSHTSAVGPSTMDFNNLSNTFPDPSLWYVLTAITLATIGRQHLIGQLWEQLSSAHCQEGIPGADVNSTPATGPREESVVGLSVEMEMKVVQLKQIAMRLREGLMKMSVLFGYPRAINALSTLHKYQQHLSVCSSRPDAQLQSIVLSRLSGSPPTRPYLNSSDTNGHNKNPNNYSRGLALFTKIYSPRHVSTLLHSMSVSSSGDLANFAVSRLYGDLLSDISILNERETGLACFVTCLALALSAGPEEYDLAGQIKGHMYGARNLGATGAEIRGAAALVVQVWESVGGGNFQEVTHSVTSVLEKADGW